LLPAEVSPLALDFGPAVVGVYRDLGIYVFNPNEQQIRVAVLDGLPPFFSASPDTLFLPDRNGDQIEVGFLPQQVGEHTALLQIQTCDRGCIAEVELRGFGVEEQEPRPDAGANPCGNTGPCPSSLTFGPVPVGSTAAWNFICSCPEAEDFDTVALDPPVEGASMRRSRTMRLFLEFAPVAAGEFQTNVVLSSATGQLVVPILLLAE
jgi:hypothetical protein